MSTYPESSREVTGQMPAIPCKGRLTNALAHTLRLTLARPLQHGTDAAIQVHDVMQSTAAHIPIDAHRGTVAG